MLCSFHSQFNKSNKGSAEHPLNFSPHLSNALQDQSKLVMGKISNVSNTMTFMKLSGMMGTPMRTVFSHVL